MCGVYCYLGNAAYVGEKVFDGLKRLEYRGYDSWGIGWQATGQESLSLIKKTGKVSEALPITIPKTTLMLGHTRWATHGNVTWQNAHPHHDCSNTLAIVHNGIIENFQELREQIKDHVVSSQTDSEILVHLIEEWRKTATMEEAVIRAVTTIKGSNAFVIADTSDSSLWLYRNGSPLVMGKKNGNWLVSSDTLALLTDTQNVYQLEDGDLLHLTRNNIRKIKGVNKTFHFHKEEEHFALQGKGHYPHFMLKEICDQPEMLMEIYKVRTPIQKTWETELKGKRIVYLTACGSAYHAALYGSYLLARKGRAAIGITASEFGYMKQAINEKDIVIALSQSGETMDTLEVVKMAQRKKAKILALVNVPRSSLWRLADTTIPLLAGSESAVAATKSFTAKIAVLMIGNGLFKVPGSFDNVIAAIKKWLNDDTMAMIQKLAIRLKSTKNIYITGRGWGYPVALEMALKIKEVSYVHAEGFVQGELKHGVIALVETGTVCIVIHSRNNQRLSTLSGAMELKARGAYLIGITDEVNEVFDQSILLPHLKAATPLLATITGQLLAYYMATARNINPDRPRNLAKSVTVR